MASGWVLAHVYVAGAWCGPAEPDAVAVAVEGDAASEPSVAAPITIGVVSEVVSTVSGRRFRNPLN
jgi:hypothetical protein